MMGDYTYLVGLVIWGTILFVAGLVAAKRERAEARRESRRSDSGRPASVT
jgi:hypothetical protein